MTIDETLFQQLLTQWNDRARAAEGSARAETYDTCAAQLTKLLASLGVVLPVQRDRESLDLPLERAGA